MSEEAQDLKKLAKRYEDHNISRVLGIVTLSMLVNVAFMFWIGWKLVYPPEADYYATTIASRAFRILALDMPNQSDSAIIDWASQAVLSIYTYNWDTWQDQIQVKSREFFTSQGWDQFYPAFIASGTLANVIDKNLIVSSVVTKRPLILEKGPLSGTYTWKVQMPVLISYQGPGGQSDVERETLYVTLLISRMSTYESAKGIGITQFISRPEGAIS